MLRNFLINIHSICSMRLPAKFATASRLPLNTALKNNTKTSIAKSTVFIRRAPTSLLPLYFEAHAF